jgi:hypothetical protein
MLRKIGFAGLFLVLLATMSVPALAQAETQVVQLRETVDFTDINPCNLNAGPIHVEGTFHAVYSVTRDAQGKLHVRGMENAQKVTAVNLDTGTEYRLVYAGLFVEQGEILDDRHSEALVEQFRLVAPGQDGEDIVMRLNLHIVSDANGEIRAWVDGGETQCPD